MLFFVENNLIMGYEEKDKKVRMLREPQGVGYAVSDVRKKHSKNNGSANAMSDSGLKAQQREWWNKTYSVEAIVKRLEEAEAEIASGDMSGWLTDEEAGVEIMRSLPWKELSEGFYDDIDECINRFRKFVREHEELGFRSI